MRLSLWVGLFLGSAASVQQYLGGNVAVAVWALACAGVVAALPHLHRSCARWSTRRVTALGAVTLVGFAVAFAVIYPRANHQSGLRGSDRDDSADIAVSAVVHGHSPYLVETYLGNRPDATPVEILLASPARLLTGHSAWENVWLLAGAFALAVAALRPRPHAGLVALWLIVPISIGALRELFTGGGLIASALFATGGIAWIAARRPPTRLAWFGAAAWLGLALTTRPNWLVLGPLVLVFLARRDGWGPAARTIVVGVGAAAVVAIPVFLADSHNFVPWRSAAGFTRLVERSSPTAFAIFVAAAVVLALLAAWRVQPSAVSLMRWAVLVEFATVIIPVVTRSVEHGPPDFYFFRSGYGVQMLVLSLGAWLVAQCAPEHEVT